jgi:hypothetical protein
MVRFNVHAYKAVEISAVRTIGMNTHLAWLFRRKMSFHRSIVTMFLITSLAASSHVAGRKRQKSPMVARAIQTQMGFQ